VGPRMLKAAARTPEEKPPMRKVTIRWPVVQRRTRKAGSTPKRKAAISYSSAQG